MSADKIEPELSEVDDYHCVLHWRDGSWHQITWDQWMAFSPFRGDRPFAPLPNVGPGENYLVVCIVENGRLFMIHPHRLLIGQDGKRMDDRYFGVFSDDEIHRYEALDKRHYASPQTEPLTEPEQKEFDALRVRLWKSGIPPKAAVHELLRCLPALPEPGDGAWKFFEAAGIFEATGRA